MSSSILTILDHIEKTITDLNFGVRRGNVKTTGNELAKLKAYSDCLKLLLPVTFTKTVFADFDRHLSYMERFFGERNFEWIMNNLDDIRHIDLPFIKENIYQLIESKKVPEKRTAPLSNKVFIVHGRSHEPMKELKVMLKEFGLNPIVLHEQPSGSRTLVEKLEKYSDVGYAFVILTPDDEGISSNDFDKEILKKGPIGRKATNATDSMLSKMRVRARQNVVLEFGFFIGLLGRDRVCCLYKGDIELPSDMHGIVYIPFKESVNEVRDKIVKELKATGCKIRI
jgi:predicted nucleotide-binding protein